MSDKNGILKDSSGNNLYPVTYTHNIYNSSNESLDNTLASKVGYVETNTASQIPSLLANYYSKSEVDALLSELSANRASRDLSNINFSKINSSQSTYANMPDSVQYSFFGEDTSGNYLWGRQYYSGFKIQGGRRSITECTSVNITLPYAMTQTNYTVVVGNASVKTSANAEGAVMGQPKSDTPNYEITVSCGYTDPNTINICWLVFGY